MHPKMSQGRWTSSPKSGIFWVNDGSWGRMPSVTLLQWQDKFSDEEACRQYLFDQRWPEGFVCPKCKGTKYWTVQRSGRTAPVYECAACGHQASVTAGTIFERTTVALRVWFWATYLIAVDKGGKSALALSRELGLPYVTAWLLHHKIQQATPERNGGIS